MITLTAAGTLMIFIMGPTITAVFPQAHCILQLFFFSSLRLNVLICAFKKKALMSPSKTKAPFLSLKKFSPATLFNQSYGSTRNVFFAFYFTVSLIVKPTFIYKNHVLSANQTPTKFLSSTPSNTHIAASVCTRHHTAYNTIFNCQ